MNSFNTGRVKKHCVNVHETEAHLIVFVPGQILSGHDEPIFLCSTFHDADVIDGQPSLSDHLETRDVRDNRQCDCHKCIDSFFNPFTHGDQYSGNL